MNSAAFVISRSVIARVSLARCCCQRSHRVLLPSSRLFSASPEAKIIPPPEKDNEPKEYPGHIKSIVDQISGLSLLEVADLNTLLKERLNIQDAPVAYGTGGPAPAAAVEQEDDEDAPEKPKEKTSFTLKLTKFDETQKVKLIKAIKALTSGMNLVQAKKFVESVPTEVKADLPKDEAEKLKEQLEAVGGTCEIE